MGSHRLSWLLATHACFSISVAAQPTGPEFLSFDELVGLSSPSRTENLTARLDQLLKMPFVDSKRHVRERGTDQIRIVFWNLARGAEWREIRNLLADPTNIGTHLHKRSSTREREKVIREVMRVRDSDIIVLNEVDFGMKRTGYADVSAELAATLQMNRAYGVEFVEIDRLYTGQERVMLDDAAQTNALAEDLRVDPARYHGLHGNAVLSRFPILSARVHRLPSCYDWFHDEVKAISALEKGRRWSATRVFEERIRRQVREGGRIALVVELGVAAAPGGRLTVVSTHLEDRATPDCRRDQMQSLTELLRTIDGPLVLAGDLNTSGADGTPTSIRREIMKRVTDERFWARQAVQWFSPVTLPRLALWPVNYWKNFRDPTAIHIPLIAPNRERALFTHLKAFRFADGGWFDFSGNRHRSGNGRSGTLGNSNERAWKGFRHTFKFERNYFGLVGTYRLDWILVKQLGNDSLVASRPRTLSMFNSIQPDGLSDHHPISVTLEQPARRAVPMRGGNSTSH